MRAHVRSIALVTSTFVGTRYAFVVALSIVLGLAGAGAWFGYSDRWLAVVSAGLSAVTFLLVFLLQYRESRDTAAIQLKLNELLRAVEGAREHKFLDLEHLAEEEQEHVSRELRDRSSAGLVRR